LLLPVQADYINGKVIHHLAPDETGGAEPTAVLSIAVEVNTKLGSLSVPFLTVVELDAFPQVKTPSVGFLLVPAFYRAQRDNLEGSAINPGQRVYGQLLAGHVVNVAAAEVVMYIQ
jgi:hypothetical protein